MGCQLCVQGWGWNKGQRSVLLFSRISSEQVWKDKGSQGRVGFLGEELEMVRRVRQTIPHSLGKKVGTAILSACIPVLAAEQTCRKGWCPGGLTDWMNEPGFLWVGNHPLIYLCFFFFFFFSWQSSLACYSPWRVGHDLEPEEQQMSLSLAHTGGWMHCFSPVGLNPHCFIEPPGSFSKAWGRASYPFFLRALRIMLVCTLDGELLWGPLTMALWYLVGMSPQVRFSASLTSPPVGQCFSPLAVHLITCVWGWV